MTRHQENLAATLIWLVLLVALGLFFGEPAHADGNASRVQLRLGDELYHEVKAARDQVEPGTALPTPAFGRSAGNRIEYSLAQWCHMHRVAGEPVDAHVQCQPSADRIAWSPD